MEVVNSEHCTKYASIVSADMIVFYWVKPVSLESLRIQQPAYTYTLVSEIPKVFGCII